jgi:undecaprenyl-diphosphatase
MPLFFSHALTLGIIQGLTEFLPISSSAHLILVPHYLHWPDPGLAFDVALHLGTLLGVVIYYWETLGRFVEALIKPTDSAYQSDRRLIGLLVLATLPGAMMGLLFEHKAEALFRSPTLIACTLSGLGLALWLADRLGKGFKTADQMTVWMALWIGLGQGFAVIPGVSRSGITITVALALGIRRAEAARFSFLMSMPIIAGAGLIKLHEILRFPDKLSLLTGFGAAAIAGLFAIWILLRYVQNHRYTPFVLYRWALGAFVLLNASRFT